MTCNINFSSRKPLKKANDNVHDQLSWEYAYMLVEATTPVNKWPQQYAVHYIYEFMNRPWLPEKIRLNDTLAWMQGLAPDLYIEA